MANTARTAQAVELDLSEFAGRTPLELSGRTPFPTIGQLTYLLTLPPYGFSWFQLCGDLAGPVWSTAPTGLEPEHVHPGAPPGADRRAVGAGAGGAGSRDPAGLPGTSAAGSRPRTQ